MIVDPMESHIGCTYPAEARETFIPRPSPSGTTPLEYQSKSGPTSSDSSAM
jgi:hypothetical protein